MVVKGELIERIRAHVRERDYRPRNKSELARALGVDPKERSVLREALAELETRGELVRGRKARFSRPESGTSGEIYRGRIAVFPGPRGRGARFLPDDADAHRAFRDGRRPGVHVPRRHLATALDGDRVEVRLEKRPPRKWVGNAGRSRARSGRAGKSSKRRDAGTG